MYPTNDVRRGISKMYEFHDLRSASRLYPHQEFVRRFMSPYTPYRKLLLYHSPGSGKSLACIACAVDSYVSLGRKCIIITRGSSGSNNFKRQILKYAEMAELEEDIVKVFRVDHYISLHNKIRKYLDEDVMELLDNHTIVFDEIHNARASDSEEVRINNSIERIVNLCVNSKIFFVTATPMVDNSKELDTILNLLGDDGYISYNSKVQQRPKIRYMGTDNDSVIPKVQIVEMRGHQKEEYEKEESTATVNDIYQRLSHIALCCFPGAEKKMITENKMKGVISSSKGSSRTIMYKDYAVDDELRKYLKGDLLRETSCKYHKLMENIERSEGSVFVSIEEVHGSGLILLSQVLQEHGYESYWGQTITTPAKRFTICIGGSDIPNMQERLDAFNSPKNCRGELIRVLLGSKVIGESITLLNVRQFHSMSPHWNYSKLTQAIGRVVRSNSHADLPEQSRTVEVYVYIAKGTVDEKKLKTSKEKNLTIKEREEYLIDNSVENFTNLSGNLNADSFIFHRMEEYYPYLLDEILPLFEERDSYYFEEIVHALDYPPKVIENLLYRMVVSNLKIRERYYLREASSKFALYTDPSLPFVLAGVAKKTDSKKVHRTRLSVEMFDNKFPSADALFRHLRKSSISYKISFFEKNVVGDTETSVWLKEMFKYSQCTMGAVLHHLLCYKEVDKAYNASSPVPSRLIGKMRRYLDGRWEYCEDGEEDVALEILKKFEKFADDSYLDFIFVSIIDNKTKLRRSEGKRDRRRTLKGRSLSSIKKEELLSVCESRHLEYDPHRRVNDLIEAIEEHYMSQGKCFFV